MNTYFNYINRLHILSRIDIFLFNKDHICIFSAENDYRNERLSRKILTERDKFIKNIDPGSLKTSEGTFSENPRMNFWAKQLCINNIICYIVIGPFYINEEFSQQTDCNIPRFNGNEIIAVLPLFELFNTEQPLHNNELINKNIIEHSESVIAYSDDIGILRNASISYALAEAIKTGDLDALMNIQNNSMFTKIEHYDVGDPLRKAKNLCISSNTLGCHAAEEGGAPVVYVRTICADFAQKIESATSTLLLSKIRIDFLTFYCKTVRNSYLKGANPIARKCYSFLSSHLSQEISMNDVAVHCNVSYEYISRIIKSNFKNSFSGLLHEMRVNRACIYLHSNISISDVAEKVGYRSSSQFCHAFHQITNKTPSQWKKDFCMN